MTRLRWFGVVVVSVIVLAGGSLWYRLSQVEAGVCIREGRVLSKEELRQAVLQNFLDHRVKNSVDMFYQDKSYDLRIGIIKRPNGTDMWKLVDLAYLRDKPFNENFDIEELAFGTSARIADLEEPFIFAFYAPPNGSAAFYASTEIQQVEDPDDIKELRKKYMELQKSHIYRNFSGFGKYYFRFLDITFYEICCGNEIPKGWSLERQLKEKEDARRKNMMYRDQFTHEIFVPVSNCGDILTSYNSDYAVSFYSPEWLGLNRNSSGDSK